MLVFFLFSACILIATFVLTASIMRPSPLAKTIDRRLDSIHPSSDRTEDTTQKGLQLLKTTAPHTLTWLDTLLGRYQVSRVLQRRLLQAQSSITVSTFLMLSVASGALGAGLTWILAPLPLMDMTCGVVAGITPFALVSLKRTKRLRAFDAHLAESIDMLTRSLRAGNTITGALKLVSQDAPEPIRSEFGEVFSRQQLGMPLRDALLQLLERVPSSDLGVLVTAILVQKDTGGNLTEILDRTAFVVRERLRIQGEIRVHTAQGRLTGWILSLLPIIMLLLINLVNPGYSSVLLHDPIGHKLIYMCLGMLSVGAFIINRIVNGIEV